MLKPVDYDVRILRLQDFSQYATEDFEALSELEKLVASLLGWFRIYLPRGETLRDPGRFVHGIRRDFDLVLPAEFDYVIIYDEDHPTGDRVVETYDKVCGFDSLVAYVVSILLESCETIVGGKVIHIDQTAEQAQQTAEHLQIPHFVEGEPGAIEVYHLASFRKFRKKPVIIEAEQYVKLGQLVRGMCNSQSCFTAGNTHPHVHTIHENQIVNLLLGDWIVPEPDGEHFYPCKPDIFEATYEPFVPAVECDV